MSFQSIYNAIKFWKTPDWLRNLLQVVQDILVQIAISVGKEALAQIEAEIIRVSSMNIDNKRKFGLVFDFSKALLPKVKDSALNLLIESLVSKLKQTGFARLS